MKQFCAKLKRVKSSITVIIPTFNASVYLTQLTKVLGQQQEHIREIIVIDSSSSDDTPEIVKQNGDKLLTIHKNEFNHGRSRNLAAFEAIGNVIIFLTQDSLPCDEYFIKNLIKPLKDPQVIASFGRQVPRPDASPVEEFARLFNYPDTPMVKGKEDLPRLGIKTFFFSNVCSAIKTKEFKELGGFPENIIMFEDLIFAAKAILKGYKIAYAPEAKVLHSHRFSLIQQFNRYLDAGISLRNNAWIFEHAGTNREGAEFLQQEIVYLSRMHQYHWILYAVAESVFKFAGFWLGLHGVTSRKTVPVSTSSINNA